MATKTEATATFAAAYGIPAVLAVSTLIAAVGIPTLLGQAGSIGEIKATLAFSDERMGRIESRLDSLDQGVGALGLQITDLKREVVNADANPFDVLVNAGLPVKGEYFSANIGGAVYVFAKDSGAEADLTAAGYSETQITPFLTGWTKP